MLLFHDLMVSFGACIQIQYFCDIYRRVSKGEREGGLPPARLKQVQFALNRKHDFFDAMPKTAGLKSSSFQHFYVERQHQDITFDF